MDDHTSTAAYGDTPIVDDHTSTAAYGDTPTVDDHTSTAAYGDTSTVDDHTSSAAYGDTPTVDDHTSSAVSGDTPTVDDHTSSVAYGDTPTVDDHTSSAAYEDTPTVDDHTSSAAYEDTPTVDDDTSSAAYGDTHTVDNHVALEDGVEVFRFFVLHHSDLHGGSTILVVKGNSVKSSCSLLVLGGLLTQPEVNDVILFAIDKVGVEDDIAVAAKELAIQLLLHWLHLKVFDSPNLTANKNVWRCSHGDEGNIPLTPTHY